MPPPYSQLDFLAEDLIAELIRQKDDPGCGIYRTLDIDAMSEAPAAPYVSIIAQQARRALPEVRNDESACANQTVSLAVRVRTDIDAETSGGVTEKTARESHAALRGRVMDLLNRDTLTADLNSLSVAGIGVQDCGWTTYTRTAIGNGIETEITVEMDCYATD